jgi:hypothetical protein
MAQPGQVERLWWPRLRWRMRGAWQWPVFATVTVLDGVLLTRLPAYERGPGTLLAGLLLAGFANLFAVGVLAPLAGRQLQRVRSDLPRLVADDYAGTVALVLVALALLAGGLAHRPALAAEDADRAAAVASTQRYVADAAPEYLPGLGSIDAMRLEEHLYRSCVPGADPRRWFCVFVTTDRQPPRVRPDGDRSPNSAYRMHGGFQ